MPTEKVLNEATLVFLVRGEEVLLARKTRGIGEGRWNSYGGGIEEGESLECCAVRECKQESKIEIKSADLQKVAEVTFHSFFRARRSSAKLITARSKKLS